MATRPAWTIRSVAAFAAALVTFTLLPLAAKADPSPATIEAKRQLEALNVEVETAAEHYNAARIALETARREAARAQARVAAKEAEVREGEAGLGQLAAAAYRSGSGINPVLQLMLTSSPEEFLDQAGTVEAVSRNQTGQVRHLRSARRALKAERELAAEKVKAADAIAADMERTREKIEASIVKQQALVAKLESADARRERLEREAAERRAAQLAAARARARELARAEAARRAALRATRSRTVARTPAYTGPSSGRASVAVAEAYRQLGKPYRWGAAGPDSFDCSGLTMWAWGKAGVSLPHYSQAQYNEGRHVSQGELRPGDLVFFGSPIHHMGMYVGGGNMIHAPQTGDVVKVSPAFRSDYAGAVRL